MYKGLRWTLIFLLPILVRFWLVSAQDLTYQPLSPHDDMLFLQHARSILQGDWLGQFSNLTLAKGPAYPIFIALSAKLKIPLLFAEQALYSFVVLIFSWAVWPILKSKKLTVVLFYLLLFQPAAYEGDAMSRVIRSGVSQSLGLLVFAGFFKAVFDRQLRPSVAIVTGLLTGLSLSFFWMNREDNLWIVPGIGLLVCARVVMDFCSQRFKKEFLTFLAVVLFFFSFPLTIVQIINTDHYQLFAITEFQHSAFLAAYGAISRVKAPRSMPFIPVTADTRNELYAFSPTFRLIQEPMETKYAPGWAESSQEQTGLDPAWHELAGGWWMWAFRDAVQEIGGYQSGFRAARYYVKLATEINQLCEQKILECYSLRTGLFPVLHREQIITLVTRFPEFVYRYLRLTLWPYPRRAAEGDDSVAIYQQMTHEKLFRNEVYETHWQNWRAMDSQELRLAILFSLGLIYRFFLAAAIVIGMLCTVYLVLRRQFLVIGLTALLGSSLTLMLMVEIIHYTSFTADGNLYLCPVYPLFIIFCFLSIWKVTQLLMKPKRGSLSRISAIPAAKSR